MQIVKLWDVRLYIIVLILSLCAEYIGIVKVPILIGTVVLLPLLYAFVLALFFNPNITRLGKLVGENGHKVSSQWILICLMPFIAKASVMVGPRIHDIVAAGPALLLQEVGNVATVLFALPIAVLCFGMGRETIGATHSIAREANVALIADRFGLKSPEGMGVMGVYVTGTLLGAIYFSMMAGVVGSWEIFDIRALSMACGVGSGSMMGACAAALAEIFPMRKDDIMAFAASSNFLTTATGMFVSLFIALPFAEWLYKRLSQWRKKGEQVDKSISVNQMVFSDNEDITVSTWQTIWALVPVSVILLLVNWVGTQHNPIEALPGLLVLCAICVVGIVMKRVIPLRIPCVAWVAVAAMLSALPVMPISTYVLETTQQLGLLSLITPALAYAGIAISQTEITLFRQSGLKIIIVALLTFTGTFVGSLVIAQALL